MKATATILLLVLCTFLFTQCASQSSIAQDRVDPNKGFEQYSSLYQALKSIPGITISGTESRPNIVLRGGGAGGIANVQPLFVIDNVMVGTNYTQVNAMVLPSNIKSIKVLNSLASVNQYGQEGRGGVILIRTKSS
ncbi:TonB-dependent receptor plug domain-containing protein [uncultured Roseivirga sp.]|uniref:TonB-dependent receptor n=1 Tax=uncultured Roseivirga sp. TaxID=543088 RepID=UPI0030DAE402|tara:strand:- start:308 stop:715 length:408 start_codon:yes stop_codon:yes gene_type:complete